jgi:hypothetical protein
MRSWLPVAAIAFVCGSLAPAPVQAQAAAAVLLTPASLDKLKNVTLSAPKTSTLDAPVAKALGIGKEGEPITVKQFRAELEVGLYVITIPVKPATDAMVFSFRDPSGVTYNYLSDGTLTLRAAMASDSDGIRSITTEEAAEGFRQTLKAWGTIAPRVKYP